MHAHASAIGNIATSLHELRAGGAVRVKFMAVYEEIEACMYIGKMIALRLESAIKTRTQKHSSDRVCSTHVMLSLC